MVYIVLEKNRLVTDHYLNVIREAITEINFSVQLVESYYSKRWNKKKDYIIVSSITKFNALNFKGFKNIFIWFQGIAPEESYIKHRNYIKYYFLNILEYRALKKSRFNFFVSNEMKKHFESKYKLTFKYNSYYIMPCYNTEIHKDSFYSNYDKYRDNYFAYVGSLSIWQGFRKVVKIYKKIEQMNITSTKLFVFTKEIEKAKNIMKDYSIENFIVDYLPPEKLHKNLANIKFGFIIRNKDIVNKISTPTKISTYIGNGVIPIYSSNLLDFERNSFRLKHKIDIESEDYLLVIKKFMLETIEAKKVYSEYSTFFGDYYNTKRNVSNISKKLIRFFYDTNEN